jgi:diguanylate cyclase (GGDEF)-like protein/PAS domain S-box-containing protein
MRSVLLLLLCFNISSSLAADAVHSVPIFVLHSYNQEYPWTKGQQQGFVETLNSNSSRTYSIETEYLDTKRTDYSPAYAAMMAKFLREKYKGYQPAAIYVTDDNALLFALSYLSHIFPDVPVFFSGINNYDIKPKLDPAHVTGVFEKKDIVPNLHLMDLIDPTVREIVAVGDASTTDRAITSELRKEMTHYPDIHVSYLSSNLIDDLVRDLKGRKERFLFLTTLGSVKDREGHNLPLSQTISAIVNAGHFVVFSMEDAYLYPGVLGGFVTSGPLQGQYAARLLLRYLDGTPVSDLAPIETSPNEYILDETELKKAGLSPPKDLKGKVTLIHTIPSHYEANRTIILGALYGLTGLLFASLAILLFFVLRKNREIALVSQKNAEAKQGLDRAQRISHTGSWTYDMLGRYVWSDEMYRIYGVSSKSFIPDSESVSKLIYPDDQPAMRAWIEECISGQQPAALEFRCVWPDGSIHYIHGEVEKILDANGKPDHLSGISRDITERKKSEELELQLGNLLKASFNEIYIIDAHDLHFIQVSDDAQKNLGYSPSELKQLTPADIKPSATLESVAQLFAPLLRGEKTHLFYESIHLRKDGTTYPAEMRVQLTGKDRSLLMAIGLDISERKMAENKLRIASIAFDSQESIVITDANAVILQVNKAFSEDTGYSAAEVVGQTMDMFKSGRHDDAFYAAMWESINRTGSWRGEIWDRRKDGEIRPKYLTITAVKGNDGIITNFVGAHSDISARKISEEQIKILAFYDPLTHLPNRRLLMDRLHQALVSGARTGRKGALLFLDLDNFKILNDTLGHEFGDLLLQQVAQRLQSCVRDGDTVARLGGDEFVVALENLSEHVLEAATQTEMIAEKVLTSLRRPYQLNMHMYICTASVGAVIFNDQRASIEELMKHADIAMYQAKKDGRNAARFFDPKMQEAINVHAAIESDLRRAVEGNQFNLYYQIQVDEMHRPTGAEALIRWTHPERGLIPPQQFIPLAEETGLILPIGHWVMEAACAQLKSWQQDAFSRDLTISVNVSAKQFRRADFVMQVKALVQQYSINPMLLKLELTESLLLDDIEETIAVMSALNEIGVKFSLDDFGTGYSSLQYLKRLPLNQLKIDQSFVRDIATDESDKAIVKTIIAIARSLNLDVIAEGVETEIQRRYLMSNGCIHFQGYLFGKPMPIAKFEELLKQC